MQAEEEPNPPRVAMQVTPAIAMRLPESPNRTSSTFIKLTESPEPEALQTAIQDHPQTSMQRTLSRTEIADLNSSGTLDVSEPSSTSPELTSPPWPHILFSCPKTGCNKTYKNPTGLENHLRHGSCSKDPSTVVEMMDTILAQEGLTRADAVSKGIMDKIREQALTRMRPIECTLDTCLRRYTNMHGLRYHYRHSGEHGAKGMRLLASGRHPCLEKLSSRGRRAAKAATVAELNAIESQTQGA
ncbi:unnamed protein product [Peniophora sp. CBMAI 1063]|nr:unnamed protein product [Peniophora sp. CBMAI 1063]